jgi:hypothetical protein
VAEDRGSREFISSQRRATGGEVREARNNRDNELDIMKRSFWHALIALVAGNAIYLSLERFLPPRGQHQLYQIDWGLAVDFWICLACYGLIRMIR